MPLWRRAANASPLCQVLRRRSAFALPTLMLICLLQPLAQCAVLSERTDAEIAELHAAMEEGFQHIANLTAELQAAGGIAAGGSLGSVGLGSTGPVLGQTLAASPASAGASSGKNRIDPEQLAKLRKLESDFAALQAQAFQIGRESADNAALAQHPQVHNYVQSLRELRPRVQDMIGELGKEVRRITGKEAGKPKKQRKTKKIRGLSEQDIFANAKIVVEQNSRDFRTKAMDFVSTFRERQMQMQDKQRDLQREMDGPDWPKEDWPLSSSDAKVVGDGEAMITSAQQELVKKMEPFGGLSRVHESGDSSVLVQIVALSDMMSGYCELIEQYVEAVKKVNRAKKKPKKQKAATNAGSSLPPLHVNPVPAASPGSLRDNLLNFGGQQQQKPFAWLSGEAAPAPSSASAASLSSHGFQTQSNAAPFSSNLFPQRSPDPESQAFRRVGENILQQPGSGSSSSAFARFANLGSTLGNLADGFVKDSAGSSIGAGSFGSQHLPPRPRAFSSVSGEL